MQFEIKKLPKSEMEIKVSIPWEEWKVFWNEAGKEFSKEVKIKGFRPGKAPDNLVEQKVGKGNILEKAAEKAIQKNYGEILAKEKIEALGAPQVEILKISQGGELEFKIKTQVMPEVKLGAWQESIKKINKDYKGKEIKVEEDDIKKELERLANSRVKLVTVNREAKNGDSVEIDFDVIQEGVNIENGSGRKHPLILGKGVFIPGFEENIAGMKANEEKEFELNFPEGYHAKNLAGKSAVFRVRMKLVQERQMPEINDDFAKSLGKFENLEALKKNIEEGIALEKKEKQKEERRNNFLDKLLEVMEAELPEILVHEELHKMINEFEMQMSGMGMEFENYLSQVKKTKEDLEKEWKPQAEKRIKAAMVLEKVAKDEEIKVANEKIEEEMNKTMKYYEGVKDLDKNINMERLYNYVKGMLTNEEVFKMLEKI
jgi:trigger factor